MTRSTSPPRRIVLMRHGSADERPGGVPAARTCLGADSEREADAAGALLAACGVRIDRAATGGAPLAVQTAQRVLRAVGGGPVTLEHDPGLAEVRGGATGDSAPELAELAFMRPFRPALDMEAQRLRGGESVGELLDRVLPAFEAWLVREDWRCLLLVLSDAVNRALLSTALVGERAFMGRIEQQPACINVLDVAWPGAAEVRAINVAPRRWLQARPQGASLDDLLRQLRHRAIGTVEPVLPR
jgi:broad specificity phosphatase PhoE